jgi:hypothetical protein
MSQNMKIMWLCGWRKARRMMDFRGSWRRREELFREASTYLEADLRLAYGENAFEGSTVLLRGRIFVCGARHVLAMKVRLKKKMPRISACFH